MNKQMGKKILTWLLLLGLVLGTGLHLYAGRMEELEAFAAARFPAETVVIDAGHGGEDGGAVSVTGVPESGINLAVALRLDQFLGLYGVNTIVLRTTDESLHDSSAVTLREKKVSDLHNRVARIEAVENATLISIHQNTYQSPKYYGAQVFFANAELTMPLAQIVQDTLRQVLDPENSRVPTKIPDSVYLMNHIACRAILVECGFLSNPEEDRKLQDPAYQTKIAAALAGAYLHFQDLSAKGELPSEG